MTAQAQLLASLEKKFNPQAAHGMDEIFQFELDDADNYYLSICNSSFQLIAGVHPDPSVTLITNQLILRQLFNGEISGSQAFMSGSIKIEGSLMLATKLKSLFSKT